jgi:hypothetical protein
MSDSATLRIQLDEEAKELLARMQGQAASEVLSRAVEAAAGGSRTISAADIRKAAEVTNGQSASDGQDREIGAPVASGRWVLILGSSTFLASFVTLGAFLIPSVVSNDATRILIVIAMLGLASVLIGAIGLVGARYAPDGARVSREAWQGLPTKSAGTVTAAVAMQPPGPSEARAPRNSGVTRMSQQLPPGAVKPGWTTTEFWQTLIVHVIAAVVALGTVLHTHFNLNGLQAIVPSVALVASAIAQGVYSHSRATVKSSAQAALASAATHQSTTASLGATPIVVQLTGVQPAHIASPVRPSAGA